MMIDKIKNVYDNKSNNELQTIMWESLQTVLKLSGKNTTIQQI